ncbi:MAG: serine/threonine-protein phosphatase [Methanomicrobiales archaeon]|nr:serine/threonine-protein phosphatase [Methanomicrobiales archaeon]NYT21275.1 serine/threonine-protein phosphatase [Methanomicrobiales archaeon]
MERYRFHACSRSIAGIRPGNEDACEVRRISHPSGTILLLAVADGLGGHPAGEVASRLAVRTLGEIVHDQLSRLPNPDQESLEALMELAFRETNHRMISASGQEEEWQGMGTTLVAALITGTEDHCIIGNIGDSRAYRVGDRLERLTRDHSRVQELVEEGILSPLEAERHPLKNIVTRIIGREGDRADITSCRLGNARILLCSDGLLDGLTEQEILAILAEGAYPAVCNALIEAAQVKSRDNITVVVAGRSGA